MQNQTLENILTLFSVVVLIDQKTRQEEMETLCDEVITLIQECDPELFYTKAMATDWFKRNRNMIEQNLKFEDEKVFIRSVISGVSDFSDKQRLYLAMLRIAHADDEYHKCENGLIVAAAKQWEITTGQI